MNGLQYYLKPRVLFKAVFAGYFLLAMHYFLPNMGGYGLYLPYNVIGWMLIAALIGMGFWQTSRTGIIELSKTQILAWIGFLFFLVPMIYPNNEFSHRAMYRILFLLGGLVFYSALVQFRLSQTERFLLLYIILGAVIMQSFLGVMQYYGLGSENYFLLMKKTLPYGSFQQKNVMTTFMATGLGISLFLIGRDSGLLTSKLKRCLVFLLPLTGSIIIMAIKSKAGYLGLVVVILLQLPHINIGQKIYQRWFAMFFTGLIIGFISPSVYLLQQSDQPGSLYTRDLADQIGTINSRIVVYETSFDIWRDNPITGIGYGKWPRVHREYSASRRASETGSDYVMNEYFDHPHNEVLLWLSEGGIAPLFGLLIFAGAYLIMVIRLHWQEALPYLALVMPIFLHTQFEFPFDSSLAHWIVFMTLIHMPDNQNNMHYRYGLHKVMIIPAVLIPLMVCYYMGATMRNNSILARFLHTEMKNYALLLKIKEPGALHLRYDDFTLKALLDLGLETKNEETLQLFLNKGEEFVRHTPLLHIYQGMMTALLALGREEEAKAMAERARYMHPDTYEELSHPNLQE